MTCRVLRLLLVCVGLALAVPAAADAADKVAASPVPEEQLVSEVATAPVEIDGRVVLRLRGALAFPAEKRAAETRSAIIAVAGDPAVSLDDLKVAEGKDFDTIMAGSRLILRVFDADGALEQAGRRELALAYWKGIRLAIADYRAARTRAYLLRATALAFGATVLVAIAVVALVWLSRRARGLAARAVERRVRAVEAKSGQLVRGGQLLGLVQGGLGALQVLLVLLLVTYYASFVLERFPWTRGVGGRLFDLVTTPLIRLGAALVDAIPNVIFLVILFFMLRFGLRLIRLFFSAVARQRIRLEGFEPEWADPTYKILRFAVIAFGIIVAYPYIPGSDSAAFKGVSIFVGVLFSLGSSSAISNIIAGYMMTYRRAFRVGDRVRIGDTLGDVVETRVQVTHLRTPKNEEVVIPNSLLLNSQVVNYSSFEDDEGLVLHTTVGIGYETPWRQVEALLKMAAQRTDGVGRTPEPFVLQKSLGDFCVVYELNVYTRSARRMNQLYSDLHRQILDVFNEYGVQIMTPAYEADTPEPKLVPKEQWFAPPASVPGRPLPGAAPEGGGA